MQKIVFFILGLALGFFVPKIINKFMPVKQPNFTIDVIAFFKENMQQKKIVIEEDVANSIKNKSRDTLLVNDKLLLVSNFNNEINQLNNLWINRSPTAFRLPFPIRIPPAVPPPCDNNPIGGCIPYSNGRINSLSFPDDGKIYILKIISNKGVILKEVKSSDAEQVKNGFKNLDFTLKKEMKGKVRLELSIKGTKQSFTTSDILIE